MINVTFITGNDKKAEFLSKYLGLELPHKKLDLDEIQSLDLRQITEHKVRQAYNIIKGPVLVEDISFILKPMGRLPGPLIRWFLDELNVEGLCRLADLYGDRRALAEVCYAYFDGKTLKFFEGKLEGSVADKPRTDDGFGWNRIFIPAGQTKANSEMAEEEILRYSLRTATVYPRLKKFLLKLN
ncbi:non-canonical purine NTP pyrophosphatase [Candidatus Saccharibacteria bacterium]|nr:non-canonical purine NTP pyrophosphatase [Candidatus Saccharibacteria bacterium]